MTLGCVAVTETKFGIPRQTNTFAGICAWEDSSVKTEWRLGSTRDNRRIRGPGTC